MKILLASNNPKKAHELRTILANSGIEILTLADVPHYDEPIEDGRTFADNALIKARAGAQHTGLVTIADDSGFTVEELNGCPGVLSARWSGQHGDDQAKTDQGHAQHPVERGDDGQMGQHGMFEDGAKARVAAGRGLELLREADGGQGIAAQGKEVGLGRSGFGQVQDAREKPGQQPLGRGVRGPAQGLELGRGQGLAVQLARRVERQIVENDDEARLAVFASAKVADLMWPTSWSWWICLG